MSILEGLSPKTNLIDLEIEEDTTSHLAIGRKFSSHQRAPFIHRVGKA
jgi:hypothetical protein